MLANPTLTVIRMIPVLITLHGLSTYVGEQFLPQKHNEHVNHDFRLLSLLAPIAWQYVVYTKTMKRPPTTVKKNSF